jgi:NAD(P)-dependent dehydrogenase (short-subunit alcohol dehydrogenase family)
VPTDITSGADVARLVEETRKSFGRIDVLSANAGVYIPGCQLRHSQISRHFELMNGIRARIAGPDGQRNTQHRT